MPLRPSVTTAPSSSPIRGGPDGSGCAVSFANVSHRFGTVQALSEISLSIQRGETVALLGRNGAGKSTAIGLMLGLLEPTQGRVTTLGTDSRSAVLSGRVGAMLQSAGLPQGATVGDLIELARGVSPRPLPASAIVERSGLGALVARRTQTLSGGEAQRVRFALAIAGDPELVFLDEPTVAMDVETRRSFWVDMRRSADEGRTILFATHYLDEADRVADRIVVLDGGRIVADGSPAELRATVTERSIRFSTSASADTLATLPAVTSLDFRGDSVRIASRDPDATVRALVHGNIAFTGLEVASPDLATAFLALIGPDPDDARGQVEVPIGRAA
jgi:ABC-2 type transport system ATP-binding protein